VLARGARWLVASRGRDFSWWIRFLQLMTPKERRVDQDLTLDGWSWHPDAQSWVEPTALAILALKKLDSRIPIAGCKERIAEGETLILDRMCPGGGWNYGNKRVLDFQLEPFADVTALALLALRGSAHSAAIRESLARLAEILERERSALALALAVLAFDAHGVDSTRTRRQLEDWYAAGHVWSEARVLALSLLALEQRGGVLLS
jgi:hypothetical protein